LKARYKGLFGKWKKLKIGLCIANSLNHIFKGLIMDLIGKDFPKQSIKDLLKGKK